jgi:chromosome transmission fidelity protein 1
LDRARRDIEEQEREYEERLAKARKREAAMKRMAQARVFKKRRPDQNTQSVAGNAKDEDEYLPDDGSDEECDMNISPALRALMARLVLWFQLPGSICI